LRLAGARAVLVSRAEWAAFVLVDGADAFTKKGTAFFPVRFAAPLHTFAPCSCRLVSSSQHV
jgi:hypothetical protein